MRTGRMGRLRRVAVIVVVTLGASGIAGCTAARDTLGTNSSPCFQALAQAKDAVHDRGVFTGVRLVSGSALSKLRRLHTVLDERSSTKLHAVCLVAYRGNFRPDQVKRPAGKGPPSGVGHFAVVAISTPQNDLLATFVLEREPVRFRHLAVGRARPSAGGAGSVVG